MALRRILTQGDLTLSAVCHPVTAFDERLHTLLDDMRETLAVANGLGLAAPQVGIRRRAALVTDENDKILELVNPVILSQDGAQTDLEGCLSVPGQYGEVTRPNHVVVRAQDRNGKTFELDATEMTARCCCHEVEHLDGHLFTEHTKRLYSIEELDEMAAEDKR
ncbi:MAG: peptide deformylase [Oscillospiraceae bacterium]